MNNTAYFAGRSPVFKCSERVRSNAVSPVYQVMIEGRRYSNINQWLLAFLEDGTTPEELELEPDEEEEE